MKNTYNPDSHLSNYAPNDPICPFCKTAVEPQHSKNTDANGSACHDYCLRTKQYIAERNADQMLEWLAASVATHRSAQ